MADTESYVRPESDDVNSGRRRYLGPCPPPTQAQAALWADSWVNQVGKGPEKVRPIRVSRT